MKILGVIGGLGPMATAYFLELLAGMTEVTCDQEHIPVILQSIPQTPDRTAYILNHQERNPLSYLIEAGKKLRQAGADYIAIPCVTAHYFYSELCKQINLPVISLLDNVAIYFENKGIKTIGLLATTGTVQSKIIQSLLQKKGIDTVVPDEHLQNIVMSTIYDQVKAGKSVDIESFLEVEKYLKNQGAESLLLGCTELSLLKRDFEMSDLYVDVLEILAAASIKWNGLPVKEYHRLV